jgi:hypothetical protein
MSEEHGFADDGFHVDPGAGGDFAGHDHHAGLDQGFAGDPALGIRGQDGVEHRVGNLVRDLVGVTFGDRFRGKREASAHA